MSGLFKRLLGRDGGTAAPGSRPAPGAGPGGGRADRGAAEAAYERLAAAALMLRSLDAELARATEGVAAEEERLRNTVEEYDRLAQAAIAGGRSIQAESAIAASERAEAALHALAPRIGDVAALRAEAASAAARIEGEAAALRTRIDTGSPTADQTQVVARAEDEAVRLTTLARRVAASS